MKAKLLQDKHYPAGWVFNFPPIPAGTIVEVAEATNIPPGPRNIRFWIDTPELREDPYGVGLYDGDFELMPEEENSDEFDWDKHYVEGPDEVEVDVSPEEGEFS